MNRVLFSFLFCFGLSAAQYYVATTGSDSNDGSIGSPWKTVSNAITHISAGDTINLRAGTHTSDTIPLELISGTGESGRTVLRTYPGDSRAMLKIYDPGGWSEDVSPSFLEFDGASYIDITNVSLCGTNMATNWQGSIIRMDNATHHVRILNSELHGSADGHGVLLSASVANCYSNWISGCEIHDNGWAWPEEVEGHSFNHGIYNRCMSNVFCNNTIWFCTMTNGVVQEAGTGIKISQGDDTGANLIYGNLCYSNGIGISMYRSLSANYAWNNLCIRNKYGFIMGYDAFESWLIHNTAWSNIYCGFQFGDDRQDNNRWINNLSGLGSQTTDNGSEYWVLDTTTGSTNFVVSHNMSYNHASGYDYGRVSISDDFLTNNIWCGTTNMAEQLVNPLHDGTGDYNVKSTSIARDAGLVIYGLPAVVAGMIQYDRAGNARDGTPDIGAYEYGGSPPAPPGTTTNITNLKGKGKMGGKWRR